MTDEELQNKADTLYALFHSMPNTEERKYNFIEWAKVRAEQSFRLYNKNNPDGKRFK